MSLIPPAWIEQATTRIAPYIRHTPLVYDPEMGIYIKWENQQHTGSFKLRGALNKILSLEAWECQQGLVTASAGNHGQGVAFAASLVHAPVIVFASDHAVPDKVAAMQHLGAEVRLVPGGYAQAEAAGIEYARQAGATWISPYNDGQIIAGQATLGLEISQDLASQSTACWIVPAGGGGLASGIGAALESMQPSPSLIAVQSEASAFLHALYHTGSQAGVVELDSLADGLAGAVETDSLTIPLVRHYVNEFILVSEAEIAQAIAYAWRHYNEKIEGSGAVALAAILTGKVLQRPAVVIISGGNIQPDVHARILSTT